MLFGLQTMHWEIVVQAMYLDTLIAGQILTLKKSNDWVSYLDQNLTEHCLYSQECSI